MDELKAMRTFAQVVASGSFAGASRALDVAPAVVTRQVADLERHLGARLLSRTTRSNALTEIGARYLGCVHRILAEVEEAAALVREGQAEARGAVRVLAPPAFAAHQLASRLPRFHARHPGVTVDVTATGPVESLGAGHDISIVVRQPALEGEFVARRLARSQVIACAAPDYLARHGRPRHPDDLALHQLLLPPLQKGLTFVRTRTDDEGPGAARPSDAESADRIGSAGRADAIERITVAPTRPLLHSTSPDLHQAGALAGIGIAGLPSFAAEQALRTKSLEHVLPGWHLADLSIWACMPSRRHVPASTRVFMDFLIDEFGGHDRDPWIAPVGRTAAPAWH
ncbi:MAG: LysR family transcriptional regulator [Burkholderiales bacterium]|nr:LysR family transcriptional regulator [Burkholderiales bacterium]